MLASICARARSVAVAGTHGKTTTVVDADAGAWPRAAWRRASSSAVTSPTPAPARSGPGATCSSSRPTRATAPTSSCRSTPRCSRTSRSTTSTTTDRSRRSSPASTSTSARSTAPRCCALDDPRCAALAVEHAATTYGLGSRRRLPRRLGAPGVGIVSLRGRASRRAARAARAAAARGPQRRQRRRCGGDGHRARRSVRRDRRGARPLRWRRPSIRRSRRRRRCDVRRRLRPPADGDRRGDRRGAGQRRQLEAGDRGVPAEPLQPHVGDVTRVRRCLRRRRRRRAHGDLCVGHDADPGGHRPPRRRCRAGGASRRSRRVAAAPRGHRSRSSPARWARATSASRWAAATSPRCPKRCWPAGWRGGRSDDLSTPHRDHRGSPQRCSAIAPNATCRWPRSRRTGSAGRRRCSCGRGRSTISPPSPAARAASGLPVLVVGRGSNLLVADAGFPGIAVLVDRARRRPRPARHRRARPPRRPRRVAAWRCPSSPADSPRPDGAVSSGPWVFPARSAVRCG